MIKTTDSPLGEFKTKTLQWLEFGTAAKIGRQLLHDLEVRASEDFFLDQLTIGLTTRVLADKLLEQTEAVSFEKDIEVAVPSVMRRIFDWFPPRTLTTTVNGTILVKAEYFHTFPQNDIVYPSGLGTPVQYVTLKQAGE